MTIVLGQEKPSLEEVLAHHGVKGMKWGIRKDKTPSTERRTIAKGTEFQTVTAGGGVNTGRRVFSSYTEKDKIAYRGKYARVLSYQAETNDIRANTYTVKKDLKVASEKDAADLFKEMYTKDPKGMTRALAESYEAAYRAMLTGGKTADKQMVSDLEAKYTKKGEDWMLGKGYTLFNIGAGQARTANSVFDSYYAELGKRGFDAMIGHTDKSAKLADDPIILLKPKQSVGKVTTIPLTADDISLARKAYKEKKKEVKVSGNTGIQHMMRR